MIFASYEFLFLFLPIVLASYYLCNRFFGLSWAKWVLIGASFCFYWYGTGWFALVFIGSVVFNYLMGTFLGSIFSRWSLVRRRLMLLAGVVFNVGLLGYYKYTDFLINNANWVSGSSIPLLHIVLPIGISFWTFQMIAYVVDAYRGQTQHYTFQNYLNFIAFFPHLLVGPIVHHKELTSQFDDPAITKIQFPNFSLGLFLLALGAAKKLLLADPLTTPSQVGFDDVDALNMGEAWLHAVSYTISYYFDLSGYADMAIGLALMFNIKLPDNFDSPYKANNFADYWRRWHMTLSRFLGDYVFRSIFKKGKGSFNFYFATFITFLVSGFWHGAGWNFILWGIFNGVFVMLAHYFHRAKITFPIWLAWGVTFLGVILLRVLFVSSELSDAWFVYGKMVDVSSLDLVGLWNDYWKQILMLVFASALVFAAPNSIWWRQRFKPNLLFGAITVAFLVASVLSMSQVAEFLYFQF